MIIAYYRNQGGHHIALCCQCGQRPATRASQGGESWYCDECCVSRCGEHSVENFEFDESISRWVDPCVTGRSTKKQQELWETVKS